MTAPFIIIFPTPRGEPGWHCRAYRWGHRFAIQSADTAEDAEELMLEAFNDFMDHNGIAPRTMEEDGVRRIVLDRAEEAIKTLAIYEEES